MMNDLSIHSTESKYSIRQPMVLVSIFLWIGFVSAISFMEAWLKFQAPGITVGLGLGIGRLVFAALNKIEWVLAVAIIINLIFVKPEWHRKYVFLSLAIGLLIVQTAWLLPALDVRAAQVINNAFITSSNLHFYYVGFEVIKVGSLLVFGISLFKRD